MRNYVAGSLLLIGLSACSSENASPEEFGAPDATSTHSDDANATSDIDAIATSEDSGVTSTDDAGTLTDAAPSCTSLVDISKGVAATKTNVYDANIFDTKGGTVADGTYALTAYHCFNSNCFSEDFPLNYGTVRFSGGVAEWAVKGQPGKSDLSFKAPFTTSGTKSSSKIAFTPTCSSESAPDGGFKKIENNYTATATQYIHLVPSSGAANAIVYTKQP